MSDPATTFFDPDNEPVRDVLAIDPASLPMPLAITLDRLQSELRGQEPVGATWALKDVIECGIKFSAAIAVSDYLEDLPKPPQGDDLERAGKLIATLLKPSGVNLGDWFMVLRHSLESLDSLAREGRLAESRRGQAELHSVFRKVKGQRVGPSPLMGKLDDFPAWRNSVLGHGVFRRDRKAYAAETLRWLPTVVEFHQELAVRLDGWTLLCPQTTLSSDAES